MRRVGNIVGLEIYMTSEWEMVHAKACRISPWNAEDWRIDARDQSERQILEDAGLNAGLSFDTAQSAAAAAAMVLDIPANLKQHNKHYEIQPGGIGFKCREWQSQSEPNRWILLNGHLSSQHGWLDHSYYTKKWRTRRELCEELAPLILANTDINLYG